MRMEIANKEHGVDAPILFQKSNIIHNPRNNAIDGKRSKPMGSELMR